MRTHAVLAKFTGTEHGFGGASGMAMSDDDRFVYVLGTLSNSVSVFERRADDTMVFVETLRQGVDGVRGMVRPADLALSRPQTGSDHQRFLYVAGQDSNSVAVFGRDESTGRLQFVQMVVNNAGGVGRSARSHGPDGLSRRGQALRVDRRAARYPGRVGRTRRRHRHRQSAMSRVWMSPSPTFGA